MNQQTKKTLIFFSLIKQPLTLLELFRWKHGARTSMAEQVDEVIQHEGLIGQSNTWFQRRISNDHARHHAWQRIDRFMWWIQTNPFIKAVAVANSAAFNNLTSDSDIDLFIVTKPKTTWLARLLIALPAKILQLRPGETNHAPICLSFFVDENHLNLKPLAIENDIYFAHWADSLIWIHDPQNIRTQFQRKNTWASDLLNRPLNISHKPYQTKPLTRIIHTTLSIIKPLETIARRIQAAYMPHSLTKSRNTPSSIYMTKNTIKMHIDDKRQEITNAHEKAI